MSRHLCGMPLFLSLTELLPLRAGNWEALRLVMRSARRPRSDAVVGREMTQKLVSCETEMFCRHFGPSDLLWLIS